MSALRFVSALPPRPVPTRERPMLAEVRDGLTSAQKELPPKFFYDWHGSQLFEEITRLPEYYLTRTERALLQEWAPDLVGVTGVRTLVELGAGSAEKTRFLLEAMLKEHPSVVYMPTDVSADFLETTAAQLRLEYPSLNVVPIVADMTEVIVLPRLHHRPALFALLGSTLGNFDAEASTSLLRNVRAAMSPGDHLLLGVDVRKDVTRIEAAYNDTRGVTAEFNRNVLRVLNRELGADFDCDSFGHRASYNHELHRIEMHLVSDRHQHITIPGIGTIEFSAGESIRTEISCKYDQPTIEMRLAAAGLKPVEWRTDPDDLFALVLAEIPAALPAALPASLTAVSRT